MMGLLQGLGQAQPVSQFIDTALKYQTTQSSMETQRLQQSMLQQQMQQMEKDNKEYDLDAALSLYPEQDRPFVKEALTMSGKVSPNGIVIGKDMREVPKLFEAYPKVAIGRGQMEYESLAKENEKLGKKGDPQSQQQMMANATRMTEIRKHIQSLSGKDEADKGFTLGEGQKRFDASGKEVAAVAPKPEEQWSDPAPMVIDGKTVMTQKSSKTGQIRTVAQGSTTNVNVDVDMGLSKGARAKAEEDVQESTDMYKGLETLVSISKPEFFTYKGQIQAGAERLGEKAGVVKNPEFLKEYTSWKVGTEQMFNRYRKWATGVAAGEKELQRIEGSFPNINMSRTEYMSALRLTSINAWKLAERRRRALNAGINDPGKQKEFYRLLPLDSMPEPPPEVTQRFTPQGGLSVMEERTLPNGQVWQQLSDGTFKQVK